MNPIFLTALVALPTGLTSLAIVRARRSARRNHEEHCGNCDGPLYAPGALGGPWLVQGHMICEPCAVHERRSLRRSLVAAFSITPAAVLGLATVAVLAPSELGAHPWLPAIATLLSYPAIFGGAVSWMKRANRQAAHRLGLQPDVLHVTSGAAAFKLTARDVARLREERTDA